MVNLDSLYTPTTKQQGGGGGGGGMTPQEKAQLDRATNDIQTINNDINNTIKPQATQLSEKINNINNWIKKGNYVRKVNYTGNLGNNTNFIFSNAFVNGSGKYLFKISHSSKNYLFHFEIDYQASGNFVVFHGCIPKNFNDLNLENGNEIGINEQLTNFWLIQSGTTLRIKVQNGKNLGNTIIELWYKAYTSY